MSIQSITISSRVVLNLHDLNNEGTEGNHQQTRMVNVALKDGSLFSVNAVSGDMIKHMVALHLNAIVLERNLAICEGCKKFDANRSGLDKNFEKLATDKKVPDPDLLDELIKLCAIDDTLGILITSGGRSLARKSVIETGWMVGIPDKVRTDSHLHVKFVPDRGKGHGEKANLGQNIFHRPLNSGIYAFIMNIDFNRIGFNDITRGYTIDEAERKKRSLALLDAVSAALIKPVGAMRNTQLPHIAGFEGAIAVSKSSIPAPSISPLLEDYQDEIKGIAESLNRLAKDTITIKEVETLTSATDFLTSIREEINHG
jgi:CRISPR-associated protein Cst2